MKLENTLEPTKVHNILNEDITFTWDGKENVFTLKAGETKDYAKFLAVHAGKKIVDRAIILKYAGRDILPLTDEKVRKEFEDQVFIQEEEEETAVEEKPEEEAKTRKLEDLSFQELKQLAAEKKIKYELKGTDADKLRELIRANDRA